MRPSGVQLARPDPPAGLDHAEQLSCHPLLVGGEHGAEDRGDDVEARVLEGKVLGVGLDELDVEALRRGPFPSPLQQRRDEVRADRPDPGAPRRGERPVAAAGGNVEHAVVGQQIERLGEVFGDPVDDRGDPREVPVGPGLLRGSGGGGEVGCVGHAALS